MQPFPLASPQPMLAPAAPPDRITVAGAAALGLHLVLLAALLLLPPGHALPDLPETSVSVEMVTPQQFSSLSPQGLDNAKPPLLATPSAATTNGAMTVATQFYAQKLLADPRSKAAREGLPKLAPDERILQLCNIEALEQVHTAPGSTLDPDIVVPYAMSDVTLGDHNVDAEGGAIRSGKSWYAIRYTCSVAADFSRVTAFAFKLGNSIPQRLWAGHNLIAGDAPPD